MNTNIKEIRYFKPNTPNGGNCWNEIVTYKNGYVRRFTANDMKPASVFWFKWYAKPTHHTTEHGSVIIWKEEV